MLIHRQGYVYSLSHSSSGDVVHYVNDAPRAVLRASFGKPYQDTLNFLASFLVCPQPPSRVANVPSSQPSCQPSCQPPFWQYVGIQSLSTTIRLSTTRGATAISRSPA